MPTRSSCCLTSTRSTGDNMAVEHEIACYIDRTLPRAVLLQLLEAFLLFWDILVPCFIFLAFFAAQLMRTSVDTLNDMNKPQIVLGVCCGNDFPILSRTS